MLNKGFEGWYFKHQCPADTVAFIPGRAESGAFLQVLSKSCSRRFDLPEIPVENGVILAGGCTFSKAGCRIDLPGISGEIRYQNLTELRSDIMGPFRHFPMQCRHGVLSMAHDLDGMLTFDGRNIDFRGGTGYAETDRGVSFPRSYLWFQCNDFPEPCSIMLSVAHIPFGPASFTGCICAIVHGGREYRLATYRGVRIRSSAPAHIVLSQGKLRLEAEITPLDTGYALSSPLQGKMTGTIRESHQAAVHCRLWEDGQLLFDLHSRRASFEYVPEKG
ncbi:tocopherol cyclase family protein [Oscillibacter sp.]|uniref:tocopherol cyclase family protein n=1 Tax=Oscillibacter sp. TaxID=1945593 RepID=UPI002603AB76|nr:tocopherol cyclase family protein [Oscillibacter sp.]MDD3347826.1 tocopherol cyclase family protein [Oscillibacter sp.]